MIESGKEVDVVLNCGTEFHGIVHAIDPETKQVILIIPPMLEENDQEDEEEEEVRAVVFGVHQIERAHVVNHDGQSPMKQWLGQRQENNRGKTDATRKGDVTVAQKLNAMGIVARENNEDGSIEVFDGLATLVKPFAAVNDVISPHSALRQRLGNVLSSLFENENTGPKKYKPRNHSSNKKKQFGVLTLKTKRSIGPRDVYITSVHLERYSRHYRQESTAHKIHKQATETLKPAEVLDKYWAQRYRYFSLFDEGIKLDQHSWFSVTPETIAEHIAERCRCNIVLDAFAGAGGNAIQFAFSCERVIAIELDPERIQIAQHNAAIYGVQDRIEFIQGDAIAIMKAFANLPNCSVDCVFLSPPWGGPNYKQTGSTFELSGIEVTSPEHGHVDGFELHRIASAVTENVAYFLPRNADIEQCAQLCNMRMEFEQHIVDDKVKTCCAYFGDLLAKKTLKIA